MAKPTLSVRTALVSVLLVLVAVFATSCGKPATGPASMAEGIVDSIAKGDYAAATTNLNATMKPLLTTQKLETIWTQLAQQVGPFKSREGTRETEEQGLKCVYVTCKFEKTVADIKVVFDSNNQVAGFFVVPTLAK
jgi:uncharacterized protein